MSEIRDEIQDFHNRRKLHILKGFSDFDNVFEKSEKGDELQKARHGRYSDNAQNRKLQRVGQEYGQAAKEKEVSPGRQPKGEEEETGDSKQPKGDNPIQNFAKEATDEQLKKYLEKNPNGEHAEVAKQELLSRGHYEDSGEIEYGDERWNEAMEGISKDFGDEWAEFADEHINPEFINEFFDFLIESLHTSEIEDPSDWEVSRDILSDFADYLEESKESIGKSSPNSSDSQPKGQPKEQREDLSGQLGDGEGFRNLNEELNDDNKTEVLSSIDNLGYNSEILMEALNGDFNLMLSMMKESDRNEILSKIDGMKPVSRAELEETMKKMQGGDEKKENKNTGPEEMAMNDILSAIEEEFGLDMDAKTIHEEDIISIISNYDIADMDGESQSGILGSNDSDNKAKVEALLEKNGWTIEREGEDTDDEDVDDEKEERLSSLFAELDKHLEHPDAGHVADEKYNNLIDDIANEVSDGNITEEQFNKVAKKFRSLDMVYSDYV